MSRPAAPSAPVPSPCIGVCRMDPNSGWCMGCWRLLGEIAAWSTMPEDAKRAVWAELPQRRAAAATPVSPDLRDSD